jgi:hypothetical protein
VGSAPWMEMLGDCCGSFFGLCGGVAGPADRGWRVEELAAQVVQQAQPGVGGVHATPAAAGAIQDGPDQVEAAGFAREPADDLDAPAGLPEGALDEVGVPDALMVLDRESQVAGELLAAGKQALDGGGVKLAVCAGESIDAGLDGSDEFCPGAMPAVVRAPVSKIAQ